jgi:hypothetical protein
MVSDILSDSLQIHNMKREETTILQVAQNFQKKDMGPHLIALWLSWLKLWQGSKLSS